MSNKEVVAKLLTEVLQAKDDLKEAIEEHGVTVEIEDKLADYADRVREIQSGIPSNYGLVTYTALVPTEAEIKVS